MNNRCLIFFSLKLHINIYPILKSLIPLKELTTKRSIIYSHKLYPHHLWFRQIITGNKKSYTQEWHVLACVYEFVLPEEKKT